MAKFQVVSDIYLEFSGMDRELDPVAEQERSGWNDHLLIEV